MSFAYCPDCGVRIYVGRRPWQGQPVSCDSCDADLEVVSTNPLGLDWPGESPDEDWLGIGESDLEQMPERQPA